jgi:hypothetical protein
LSLSTVPLAAALNAGYLSLIIDRFLLVLKWRTFYKMDGARYVWLVALLINGAVQRGAIEFYRGKPVLQTLVPNESYRFSEHAFVEDRGRSLNFGHYIDILRRRVFYFLLPFGLISSLEPTHRSDSEAEFTVPREKSSRKPSELLQTNRIGHLP